MMFNYRFFVPLLSIAYNCSINFFRVIIYMVYRCKQHSIHMFVTHFFDIIDTLCTYERFFDVIGGQENEIAIQSCRIWIRKKIFWKNVMKDVKHLLGQTFINFKIFFVLVCQLHALMLIICSGWLICWKRKIREICQFTDRDSATLSKSFSSHFHELV